MGVWPRAPLLVTKLTNGYFFEAPHRLTAYDVSSESECRNSE
jgi:hypothetical protein